MLSRMLFFRIVEALYDAITGLSLTGWFCLAFVVFAVFVCSCTTLLSKLHDRGEDWQNRLISVLWWVSVVLPVWQGSCVVGCWLYRHREGALTVLICLPFWTLLGVGLYYVLLHPWFSHPTLTSASLLQLLSIWLWPLLVKYWPALGIVAMIIATVIIVRSRRTADADGGGDERESPRLKTLKTIGLCLLIIPPIWWGAELLAKWLLSKPEGVLTWVIRLVLGFLIVLALFVAVILLLALRAAGYPILTAVGFGLLATLLAFLSIHRLMPRFGDYAGRISFFRWTWEAGPNGADGILRRWNSRPAEHRDEPPPPEGDATPAPPRDEEPDLYPHQERMLQLTACTFFVIAILALLFLPLLPGKVDPNAPSEGSSASSNDGAGGKADPDDPSAKGGPAPGVVPPIKPPVVVDPPKPVRKSKSSELVKQLFDRLAAAEKRGAWGIEWKLPPDYIDSDVDEGLAVINDPKKVAAAGFPKGYEASRSKTRPGYLRIAPPGEAFGDIDIVDN